MKSIPMVGNRYGKLVVKEMLYGYSPTGNPNAKKRTFCLCQCDCGNEVIANAFDIRIGKKQSCGCDSSERRSKAFRYDLAGKRFGRLTVIETLYGSKVKCVCDCGNIVTVSTTDLISGHTKSCGCFKRDRISETQTKDYTGTVSDYGVKILRPYMRNNKQQWLWECECGVCGSKFVTFPARVLNGHTTSCGCRKCSSNEQFIKGILDNLGVEYTQQYSIPGCRKNQTLLFDFAIFKENELLALIEYDGKQHFEPIEYFGGEAQFLASKERDEIKDTYCMEHGIPLYRLPYTMTNKEIEQKVISICESVETVIPA